MPTNNGTPRTFVLTGATGFLGSHLMAALLERGHRLVLFGRPAGETTLAARIGNLLEWFGLQERNAQLEPVEVDLLKPWCGLEPERYRALCATAGGIIHCASDTRFSERTREESIATNVQSLGEMIGFARESNASCFHYVSTAYAAGVGSPSCTAAPAAADEFLNVYEETKAHAEREVAARCGRLSIPFTIIRPSIVYGDSRSGRATRFNALYNHVKSLYYIREIYLNDIENHGGKKSQKWGIYRDDDGGIHIPLRVVLPRRGHINLIPVDYFVSATLAILARPESGAIYHLTSDSPVTAEDIASYCESFLNMKGIEIVYTNPAEAPERNPAEELFNKFIEPYRPYLSDMRTFDRSTTNRATAGQSPPEFSYELFHRCMAYAVSVNWGSRKEGPS